MREPETITEEELRTLDAAVKKSEFAPWLVETDKNNIGENWFIASFGNDGEMNSDVYLTTDRLHVSECRSDGPLADATAVALLRRHARALILAAARDLGLEGASK